MQQKTCTNCKIEKLITEFSKAKSGKYGVAARCKCCYKLYVQDNKEQFAERDKKYRQDNKELISKNYKQWYKTPKGKASRKAAYHNRRALEKNATGSHTGVHILALLDLQTGACPYCDAKLNKSGKNKYHIDHIVPLSKGGSNDIGNIQLLCPKCNMSKHDKLPEEFAQQFNKLF